MKSGFAALLLLMQLQPVIGVAACLGLVQQRTTSECEMPEHGTMPSQDVSESAPPQSQSCALAVICTPAPLAIPCLPGQVETKIPVQAAVALVGQDAPVDVFSPPPFHPPRV